MTISKGNPLSAFQDLITKANLEKQPQRLLFLFAKANSMMGEAKSYHSGTIDPVMCVDKLPSELTSFSDFIEEADGITKEWDFILVSTFPGINGVAPTSADADPYLQSMSNSLANGADLSQFLIWDREEQTIITS